ELRRWHHHAPNDYRAPVRNGKDILLFDGLSDAIQGRRVKLSHDAAAKSNQPLAGNSRIFVSDDCFRSKFSSPCDFGVSYLQRLVVPVRNKDRVSVGYSVF